MMGHDTCNVKRKKVMLEEEGVKFNGFVVRISGSSS